MSADQSVIPKGPGVRTEHEQKDKLRNAVGQLKSKEIVFGVVGYAGSGTSFSADQIRLLLEKELANLNPSIHLIKARDLLNKHIRAIGGAVPSGSKIQAVEGYQTAGDELRRTSEEHGAVAAYAVQKIRALRGEKQSESNVYIVDSIKHPAEVELLRAVYGDAFVLVGVGCRPDVRKRRLERKYGLRPDALELRKFVDRDSEDSVHKYGQHVNDTFHLADYFVDNTSDSASEKEYVLPDQIKRLFDILFTRTLRRPNQMERGMYHAHAAAMRSSCLSRQVGASILDIKGNLLSVGSNEVPKYGGGSYDGSEGNDHRCFAAAGYCSNTREQNQILASVLQGLKLENLLSTEAKDVDVLRVIGNTRIKALIEFSRSVHAEMDAIISMARSGSKLEAGSTLYSTTYPCHSCARHIVAAGIECVVYLEPYSKSLAIGLHQDSIADNLSPELSKDRVKFRPYEGVSPRLYRRVYLKTGELKDSSGTAIRFAEEKGPNSSLLTKAYTDIENDIVQFVEQLGTRT